MGKQSGYTLYMQVAHPVINALTFLKRSIIGEAGKQKKVRRQVM